MQEWTSLVLFSFASAIVSGASAGLARADGPTQKRPLSAFLDSQATQVNFIPPVPDYWGWTAPPPGVRTPEPSSVDGTSASCDDAGIANKWLVANSGPNLGTRFSGSVTQRALDDGRILAKVELHIANALTFGLRVSEPEVCNFGTDPLNVGARAQRVLAGATPRIGECHASFTWK